MDAISEGGETERMGTAQESCRKKDEPIAKLRLVTIQEVASEARGSTNLLRLRSSASNLERAGWNSREVGGFLSSDGL